MRKNTTTFSTSNPETSDHSSKAFLLTAADGTPLQIPPGEFYISTKARPRRLMKNSLSNTARRIHACLELMTMGWKQELAIVKVGRKTVNATREHISEQTGIAVQHVSDGLAELKAQGLGDCREDPADKRKVEIYSWAVPRAVEMTDTNVATFVIPEWVPVEAKYLRSYLKRSRRKTYDNLDHLDESSRRAYLEELVRTSQAIEEAELRMSRLLEPNVAPADLYKEERTERNSQSVSPVVEEPDDRPTDILTPTNEEPPPEPPSPAPAPQEDLSEMDPLLAPVLEAIPLELSLRLNERPTVKLLDTIHRNLAGAPPALLTERIRQRQKVITSMGILANLAQDVGSAWKRQAVAASPPTHPDPRPTPDEISTAEYALNDPDERADIKQWAREILQRAKDTG